MEVQEEIQEEARDRQQSEMMSEGNEIRLFSVNEVGDLLKSRKNLVYMFRISGELTRFLLST